MADTPTTQAPQEETPEVSVDTETTVYTIDASGRSIGRVATEVAHIVMGKNAPEFAKNKIFPVLVHIEHAAQLSITDKKRRQKEYQTYSGYPGGQKVERLEETIAKKGYGEVLRRAIYGMLPSNKLRARRMQQIEISE